MPQKEYNFDHVSILMPGGGYNLITKKEFLAKPLDERIKLVNSGQVEFILDGEIVSLRKAFNF